MPPTQSALEVFKPMGRGEQRWEEEGVGEGGKVEMSSGLTGVLFPAGSYQVLF